MDTEFLDWALAAFSGYVAADELYDQQSFSQVRVYTFWADGQ